MLKDFRAFILRGNVVDLAIAVAVGAAFGAVVTSVTTNLITPLIAIPGKSSFASWQFTIRHSHFHYGAVLDAIVSFVAIAAVLFFVVVRPLNKLQERRAAGTPTDEPSVRECPRCLSKIPVAATRCAFCTSTV